VSIIQRIKEYFVVNRQDSIIFEVTQRCNNRCKFCYNVWYLEGNTYPKGELSTQDTKRLLRKIIKESGCTQLTFSGGEPFLREDLIQLISFVRDLGVVPTIISNGTLIDEETAKSCIDEGVTLFELPLLSSDRTIHNELSQNDAFDSVTESIANIKLHGGQVVTVFVGTRKNIDGFEGMIELSLALGADGIMFNRFNPGGRGASYIDELLPTPQQVGRALEVAEQAMERHGAGISCSIPIQPCLVDISRFKSLSFGFCAAGTERAYYTVDPLGNLRVCNHTPSILGNILDEGFSALTRKGRIDPFLRARPEFCKGCQLEDTCLGGCKAAAQVCYGSLCAEEPFLRCHLEQVSPRSWEHILGTLAD
jgi:radical SAM protein with 4Fe4S-binding SPASM domain